MKQTTPLAFQNPAVLLCFFLGFLLLGYTSYRAYVLSFTFDESFSYTAYATRTVPEILGFYLPTANNHLLNSLLMKLSDNLFGNHPFALRLPNLLAHAAYLI